MNDLSELRVRAYNVGFGDCFLITICARENQFNMLVDLGSDKDCEGIHRLESVIQNIKDVTSPRGLDIMVISHTHLDHMRGLCPKNTGTNASDLPFNPEPREIWLPAGCDPSLVDIDKGAYGELERCVSKIWEEYSREEATLFRLVDSLAYYAKRRVVPFYGTNEKCRDEIINTYVVNGNSRLLYVHGLMKPFCFKTDCGDISIEILAPLSWSASVLRFLLGFLPIGFLRELELSDECIMQITQDHDSAYRQTSESDIGDRFDTALARWLGKSLHEKFPDELARRTLLVYQHFLREQGIRVIGDAGVLHEISEIFPGYLRNQLSDTPFFDESLKVGNMVKRLFTEHFPDHLSEFPDEWDYSRNLENVEREKEKALRGFQKQSEGHFSSVISSLSRLAHAACYGGDIPLTKNDIHVLCNYITLSLESTSFKSVFLETVSRIRFAHNNWSIVLKVCYGHCTLLFTGDLERWDLIEHRLGKVDFLKVPHHGSSTHGSLPGDEIIRHMFHPPPICPVAVIPTCATPGTMPCCRTNVDPSKVRTKLRENGVCVYNTGEFGEELYWDFVLSDNHCPSKWRVGGFFEPCRVCSDWQ